MSVEVISLIWKDHTGTLSATEKSILLRLADFSNAEGHHIYPGYSRISKDTGLCVRTVIRTVKSLISKNILTKIKKEDPKRNKAAEFNINVQMLQKLSQESGNTWCHRVTTLVTQSHHPSDTESYQPSLTVKNINPIVPLKRDDRFSKQFIKEKFKEAWKEYPKQESIGSAERAYTKALRQNEELTPESILVAIRRYAEEVRAKGRKPEFIKCFSRWLADKCWLDGNCESPKDIAARIQIHLESQDKITAHGINLGRLARLLIDEFGEATYKSWFSPMVIAKIIDGRIYIQAPNHFMAGWVEKHYSDFLLKALQQINQSVRSVEIHAEKRIAA